MTKTKPPKNLVVAPNSRVPKPLDRELEQEGFPCILAFPKNIKYKN